VNQSTIANGYQATWSTVSTQAADTVSSLESAQLVPALN